jgi:hypothetical protein
MLKTKEALEKLGVYVEIAIGAQTPDLYASFDLVHIFNVQTYNFSLAEAGKAKKAGKPIALSPIFWDFWDLQSVVEGTAYWSPKWKAVRKLFGWNLTKALRKGYWFLHKSRRMHYKIKLLLKMADVLLPNSKSEMDLLRRQFHLYCYTPRGCYFCKRLFNAEADISVGDDWLIKTEKKIGIVIAHTEVGKAVLEENELLELERISHPEVYLPKTQPLGYALKCSRLPDSYLNLLEALRTIGHLNRFRVTRKVPRVLRSVLLRSIRRRTPE